jgi:sugar phosphate permease
MTQRRILSVTLLITLLIAYLDRVNVSVIVADSKFLQDMGIGGDAASAGLLMSLFLLTYGISNMFLSPIGDRIGPKRAMMVAIILWMGSLMIGGLAPSLTILLISRIILGFGEGLHWPMQSKFVKNWFPPNERGKANATWGIALYFGPAIAMPFFVFVIQTFGWRESFGILIGLGLIPLFLLGVLTSDCPQTHPRISKDELVYITDGMKEEMNQEAALTEASVWDNVKIFITDYRYWLLVVYYIGNCSIWWGIISWLPSYLKIERGFTWASMGMLSSLPYLLATCLCVVGGYLGDRMGRRGWLLVIALMGPTLGLYFGAHSADNMTAALLISVGVGCISLGVPSCWTLLQQFVPSKAVGTGAGLMNGISSVISGFIPVLIGMAIDTMHSYSGGLMMLCVIGIICACGSSVLALKKY